MGPSIEAANLLLAGGRHLVTRSLINQLNKQLKLQGTCDQCDGGTHCNKGCIWQCGTAESFPVVDGHPAPACELMPSVVISPALVEWPSWVPLSSGQTSLVALLSVNEHVPLHVLLLSHD